jgi:hypothetical protein
LPREVFFGCFVFAAPFFSGWATDFGRFFWANVDSFRSSCSQTHPSELGCLSSGLVPPQPSAVAARRRACGNGGADCNTGSGLNPNDDWEVSPLQRFRASSPYPGMRFCPLNGAQNRLSKPKMEDERFLGAPAVGAFIGALELDEYRWVERYRRLRRLVPDPELVRRRTARVSLSISGTRA